MMMMTTTMTMIVIPVRRVTSLILYPQEFIKVPKFVSHNIDADISNNSVISIIQYEQES